MTEPVITGLFTLGGVLLGVIISAAFSYVTENRSRKDKYLFALLDKRVEIYQAAYRLCANLAYSLESCFNDKIIQEADEWYDENNLYLSDNIRKDFKKLTNLYRAHPKKMKQWDEEIKNMPGKRDANKEIEEKMKKSMKDFEFMVNGFRKIIQDEVNEFYYKQIGKI